MTRAGNIVMTGVIEYCVYTDMEHCAYTGMEHCDEKISGALWCHGHRAF